MLERMVAPRFQHPWSKLERSRPAGLRRAIAVPRCIDRRRRSDFQRLLYRLGRLTRSRIASRLHSTDEKLLPRCQAAELQLTRCRPALNLRMAEFDAGTIHIQQRAHQFFPVPLALQSAHGKD